MIITTRQVGKAPIVTKHMTCLNGSYLISTTHFILVPCLDLLHIIMEPGHYTTTQSQPGDYANMV